MKYKKFIFLIILMSFSMSCTTARLNKMIYSEDIELAKDRNYPIVVTDLWAGIPNYRVGVNVTAEFLNISDRTIKYVIITVKPFNEVGDAVYGKVTGKKYAYLRYTGPLNPGEETGGTSSSALWEDVWYNKSIVDAKVKKIKVVYMDGEEKIIDGLKLALVLVGDVDSTL